VGGLLASEPATLFLLPAIPSLIVRDTRGAQSQHSPADEQERDTVHEPRFGCALNSGTSVPILAT
jgi:hypothetical protein